MYREGANEHPVQVVKDKALEAMPNPPADKAPHPDL
jgi:hypothetical protein